MDGGWYYDADGEGLYTALWSIQITLPLIRREIRTVSKPFETNSGDDQTSETTQLLRAWAEGDKGALERLTPRVYRTLRRIAGYQMQNEREGNSMQATALVHEAYLELIDVTNVNWQHRAHFFAVSAQIMRHILLDRARRRVAAKRGGAAERVNLDELPDLSGDRARELIALEDALNTLAENDPRKARVVELRFFGGLSVDETAEVLAVSPETVMRDWKFARSWLQAELSNN
jgi:RNA polymerase sigma factor (TIGR02999 family)